MHQWPALLFKSLLQAKYEHKASNARQRKNSFGTIYTTFSLSIRLSLLICNVYMLAKATISICKEL